MSSKLKDILAKAGVQTQSPQESQSEQLMNDIAAVLEKHGTSLAELGKQGEKLAAEFKEVAKLKDTVEQHRALTHEQLRAISAGVGCGPNYRGSFASREAAAESGHLLMAMARREKPSLGNLSEAQAKLLTAAASGTTGAAGGAIVRDALIGGIIRNVETYGVLERNARVIPVGSQRGAIAKRTGGVAVSYPDIAGTITEASPTFGSVPLDLTRYSILTAVDNSMLQDDLAVGIAEFVALEFGQAFALATDSNGFVGTGSPAFAKVTGLFNLAVNATNGPFDVTADTGDNTFAEVVAASSKYLAKMIAALPQWAENNMPKWYMSRSMWGEYLGVRDTQGHPIWNVIVTQGQPQLTLMGYPVEITQVAPKMSDTGNSKNLLLLAAMQAAVGLGRHTAGISIEVSRDAYFTSDQTGYRMVARQAIALLDGAAVVRLVSAAS